MINQTPPVRAASYDKKVGLVLQGGGALGSHQAGVFEGLASSEYQPDWAAGISIGAINAAMIAGNALENRVRQRGNTSMFASVCPLLTPVVHRELRHGHICGATATRN
jgi:predicted acylesterase/phospholipase RssA